MQRGVTTQQLQRVRKKYQQQQQQMGAVDATERVSGENRLRQEEEKAFGTENNRYMTTAERRQMMYEELNTFGMDSVVVSKGASESDVFGRNISTTSS